jgi:hypothetical protein
MGNINAITLIKSARETAIKNRQAAITKAAEPFNKEIASYDMAIRHLSGTTPVKGGKATKKTASPVRKVQAKKAVTKKTPVKKVVSSRRAPVEKRLANKKLTSGKSSGGYPAKGTILEKMAFVLKQSGRFMSIGQIAEQVKKHEPAHSLDGLKRRFSKHLNKFKAAGRIVSYAVQATNKMYYGLPEYMEGGKSKKANEHQEK